MSMTIFFFLIVTSLPSLAQGDRIVEKSRKTVERMGTARWGREVKPVIKHPGFITSVEYPGGKETKKFVADVPLKHQFVFLKNGQEVDSAKEADTIIPIVRVEAYFSEDRKQIIEIREIGPDGQSLRRTYGAR